MWVTQSLWQTRVFPSLWERSKLFPHPHENKTIYTYGFGYISLWHESSYYHHQLIPLLSPSPILVQSKFMNFQLCCYVWWVFLCWQAHLRLKMLTPTGLIKVQSWNLMTNMFVVKAEYIYSIQEELNIYFTGCSVTTAILSFILFLI